MQGLVTAAIAKFRTARGLIFYLCCPARKISFSIEMSFARTPSGSVLTPLGLQHQNSASMRFKKSLWQVAIGGAVVAIAGALRGRLHLQFIYSIPFFARDPVLRSHQNFLIASVVGWVIFSAYWEIAAKDS